MKTKCVSRSRILRTIATFCVNVCLACGCAILGPTIVSMGYLLQTDTFHMALALGGVRLGMLIGTILCGFLYTRLPIPSEIQLMLGCSLIAVSMATAPWLPQVFIFITAIILVGIGSGYIDAACQPYIMNLWQGHKLRNTFLQALHFNWSLFSTIIPYIVSLFLVDIPHESRPLSHMNGTQKSNGIDLPPSNSNINMAGTVVNNSGSSVIKYSVNQATTDRFKIDANDSYTPDQTSSYEDVGRVRWAYVLLGALSATMTLYSLFIYLITKTNNKKDSSSHQLDNADEQLNKTDKEKEADQSSKAESQEIEIEHQQAPRTYRVVLLSFLFFYSFVYQTVEGIPGGFLPVFCVKGLGWHQENGAKVLSVYFGMQGIGRLSSMFLAYKISPRTQIIINLSFLGIGLLLLQFVVELGSASLWASMALAGFGLGSSLPSSLLWITAYTPMTSVVSSAAMAGGGLSGIVMLSLTGYLFDQLGPFVVLRILGFFAFACILVYTGMHIWASHGLKLIKNKHEKDEIENKEDNSPLT